MSTEQTRALVHRYQDALNAGRYDELDEILAEDVELPGLMPGFSGREGAKELARQTQVAWPDWHVNIDDLLAEGDEAVARITMTGTAEKPLLGMLPGTGRSFRIAGQYHVRVRDGRIAGHLGIEDSLGLMAQITGEG